MAPFARPSALAVARTLAALLCIACRDGEPAQFVGSAACRTCHTGQFAAWTSSQHAKAMQAPGPATVLGRFDGAQIGRCHGLILPDHHGECGIRLPVSPGWTL